jgi:3'(2'), 5'-bisphosphate nucleotidase
MTVAAWQRELDVALETVGQAAALARDIHQRIGTKAFVKADQSPATVGDFAVQALVAHRLREAFPDDPLVAEEDSRPLRTPEGQSILQSVLDVLGGAAPRLAPNQVLEMIDRGEEAPGARFWTLDPIDGTKGFVRGGQYVVALALIVDGCVQIGLLGCPELSFGDRQQDVGSLLYAVRNRGAYRLQLAGGESTRLQVSSCGEPRSARVLRSVETSHLDLKTFDATIWALGVGRAPTLMDSQAKHAVIAAGQADLLIRIPSTRTYRDQIWDHAPGTLLIEEAGGRVTDLQGDALDFNAGRLLARNEGVIASNGALHAAVLEAVRSAR